MIKTTVIYILGLPATGKSTLAKNLSVKLNLPLISKDALKGVLLDHYGWTDRETSRQAGQASYGIIDYIIEAQARAGKSIIVESTTPNLASDKFKIWQNSYGIHLVQVYCEAEPEVIRARFNARIKDDAGHVSGIEGNAGLKNLEDQINRGFSPIKAKSEIIRIDTTDFNTIDEPGLIAQLREMLLK